MAAPGFLVDGYATAPPAPTADPALDQAMLRAYAAERAMDYGACLDDVLKLRRRVEAGHAWADIALQLADDNERRAAHAAGTGQAGLEYRCWLHAAACSRLAQAGLEHDGPRRLQAYERQAHAFGRAMRLAPEGARGEALDLGHHAAWLFAAPGLDAGGAAVVVWGGADGWCEAFHPSVPFYLERGLSVCLLELPGQGLARLRHGALLDTGFTRVVSAVLDTLAARGAGARRFGVVGHSAGGSLALAAAAADDRISACCSNGGSVALQQGLLKYPRVLQRLGRMLGNAVSDADVLGFIGALRLEDAATRMRAALLCLHGGRDALVTDEEAHRLVALRGEPAATLARWPDGVHCLYDHMFERNTVLADWFAAQLAADGTPATPTPWRSL